MKKEDEGGEIDVNYKEFKRQRDMARRSPYPSVIVEVQSTPPADFGARSEEAAMEAAAKLQNAKREAEGVSSDDVQKLEVRGCNKSFFDVNMGQSNVVSRRLCFE